MAQSRTKRTQPKPPLEAPQVGPRWAVEFTNLGKIKSATIEMAPLVVLVGRNNTGKSYAASLLWALMNLSRTLFRNGENDAPRWFRNFIKKGQSNEATLANSGSTKAYIERHINSELANKKEAFFSSLFSSRQIVAESIKLRLQDGIAFDIRSAPATDDLQGSARIEWSESFVIFRAKEPENLNPGTWDFLFTHFIDHALGREIDGARGDPVYLPAARTGLMLALKPIVSQLLDSLRLGDNTSATANFPLPLINFLRRFTAFSGESDGDFSRIAKGLEERIIKGKVRSTGDQIPEFVYAPDGQNISLPLHLTSSMVTELAPFLLLLRRGDIRHGLVFEEPEAHLHLAAQRELARSIAQLVNAGVPVVLTTHSDTFLQQINLLLGLNRFRSNPSALKRLGYREDELLDPKAAKGYEFRDVGDGTTVSALTITEDGFVVPSINETLESLSEDLRRFESEAEREG